LAWLAGGCAWRARAIPVADLSPVRAATLDEVVKAHERATGALSALSASGRLELIDQRGGRQRSFGARVLCGRGGRLYLKASVAVVTALEATSDGRVFWLAVPSKHKVWTGDATRPPRVAAGADSHDFEALRPSDLAAALLPEPLDPRPGEVLLLESEREWFSLALGAPGEAGRGHVRRRVWLERATLHPGRARTYDAGGELALETTWGDWRDGVPWRVGVSRPAQGYAARLTFDKVQANVALPERAFTPRLSPEWEVVELDARP
jgi:hypothetical protein